MTTRFLAIGHVTRDEFEGEPWRLGGTALYAAATAARLGTPATLATRVGPDERAALEERCASLGIALHAAPSNVTTTFVFRYESGIRRLRLRARARALTAADVPAGSGDPGVAVVIGPVAHEIDGSVLSLFDPSRVVVTAQGYLREWSADGTVRPRAWDEADAVLTRVGAVVLSEEDVGGDLGAPRRWAASTTVIVTRAERGATVLGGEERDVAAFRSTRVVDPTGAGDAFAAGFAIARAEGRAVLDAVRFANAVASFAIEDVGTAGLADRARVEDRLDR